MRRLTAAALGLLLGVGLTACGDKPADIIDFEPVGPGHGTRASQEEVASYADDVLLSVYTTGGMGEPGTYVPDVEVRNDGTVYLNGDDGLGVDTFMLTAAGLDRVRELFQYVSLRQVDYEESDWTDQPSTSVFTTLGGRPEAISVYGLGFDDDLDDDDWDKLLDAIGDLDELADTASGTTNAEIATQRAAYRPDRLALLLFPDDEAGGTPWPLARPFAKVKQGSTEFGSPCLSITGPDVISVEELADEGSSGLRWSIGTTSVNVVVRPVLPGTDDPCTPKAPETPVG